MKERIISAIIGACGFIYGIEIPRELKRKKPETHLIISGASKIAHV